VPVFEVDASFPRMPAGMVLGGVGGHSGSGRCIEPRAAALVGATNPVAGSRTWRVTRPS